MKLYGVNVFKYMFEGSLFTVTQCNPIIRLYNECILGWMCIPQSLFTVPY